MTDLFALTRGERQDLTKKIVIEHARFKQATDGIARFHRPVVGGLPDRGSLGVLIGDSRTGKTFAAERYRKKHPASVGESGMIFPVVRADMPAEGGACAILLAIAQAIGINMTARASNQAIFNAIERGLVTHQVELLILDEAELFIKSDKRGLLGYVRDLLRKLVDIGAFNVLCVGLEETYDVVAGDTRLARRGMLPFTRILPYEWECEDDKIEFRKLCHAFDEKLPFNARSGLASLELASCLHWVSEGNIGVLHDMIYFAAWMAINDDADRVEARHFEAAYETRMPYGNGYNPFRDGRAKAPKTITPKTEAAQPAMPSHLFTKTGGQVNGFSKH